MIIHTVTKTTLVAKFNVFIRAKTNKHVRWMSGDVLTSLLTLSTGTHATENIRKTLQQEISFGSSFMINSIFRPLMKLVVFTRNS